MPKTILGIDVGSYSVKIAEIERSFKSFQLVHFYERKIAYNEVLTVDEAKAATVRGLLDDYALTGDIIIMALPGEYVSSRVLTLPFGNTGKIKQTIGFEIENFIPYDLDNIIYDYHIVNLTKDSSRVLAVYAKKDEVVKFISAFNAAEIDPRILSVEGIEYVNLITLGMSPPDGLYAFVDIGHRKTTMTIFNGRRILYSRVILIGGMHISDEIAKNLGVPIEEAEKLKIEMGQAELDEDTTVDEFTRKINVAIGKVLDELTLHLRQTFFSFRDGDEVVSGLYLSGGTSRMPGIDRFLSIKLKQNVAFLDVLSFHFAKLEDSEVHPQIIPQALAIALRGVAPAGLPTIDFRQGELAYKGKDAGDLGMDAKKVTIALAAIVVLALTYYFVRDHMLTSQVDQLTKEVKAVVAQAIPDANPKVITGTKSALALLRSKAAEYGDKARGLSDIIGTPALDILMEISKTLPPRAELKLDIDKLEVGQGRVRMSGRTTSFESVDKIKLNLEKSELFANVATGNVRKGLKDAIQFDVTMDYGAAHEGAAK